MGSSRLLVLCTLVLMVAISYELLFSGIGVSASDAATTCYNYCNQKFEELAHKDDDVKVARYKIYGDPYSPNTRRVLAVLHEKNLSYDPITVDLKAGEQKKPPFLSLNPFGQVPVFLDGDLKLTESRAISEYIATVHISRGSRLLNHKSYKAMGTQTMWMYIESLDFDPHASILTFEQTIKPMKGLKTDYKVVNETEAKLEKVLDIYEKRLKVSSYLATNFFTLADLYHLPNIQYLMDTPTKRLFQNRPSVNRWVDVIMARPAWKKACDVNAWYDKVKN